MSPCWLTSIVAVSIFIVGVSAAPPKQYHLENVEDYPSDTHVGAGANPEEAFGHLVSDDANSSRAIRKEDDSEVKTQKTEKCSMDDKDGDFISDDSESHYVVDDYNYYDDEANDENVYARNNTGKSHHKDDDE